MIATTKHSGCVELFGFMFATLFTLAFYLRLFAASPFKMSGLVHLLNLLTSPRVCSLFLEVVDEVVLIIYSS